MQTLNDVTGRPLSARARDQQCVAMDAQIRALTECVNQQTAVLNAHEARLNTLNTLAAKATSFRCRSFWLRLRWLLAGR